MISDLTEVIAKVASIDQLLTLEQNIRRREAVTDQIEAALQSRYAVFGRDILSRKTDLDLSNLSPAESRIVEAISRYVGLQRRVGKFASRTISMVANRGLIGAAEVTVCKSKQSQGFDLLTEAGLKNISFEQIVIDHPYEFSDRALWFARRTLGFSNESEKPPSRSATNGQN